MVRSIALALVIAACLYAFSWLGEAPGGPFVRACAGVLLGVIAASAAYGESTWTTIVLGALSPLSLAAFGDASLALAASVMCFCWLVPRFALARTRQSLAILVAASFVAAAVAGWVYDRYVGGPIAAQLASCVFAGSCLALVTILVPVDTGVGCALRTAAAHIDGPVRDALERAAAAHLEAARLPSLVAKRAPWRKLVRMADARAALERARGADAIEARSELDERIETLTAQLASHEAPEPPTSAVRAGVACDAPAQHVSAIVDTARSKEPATEVSSTSPSTTTSPPDPG